MNIFNFEVSALLQPNHTKIPYVRSYYILPMQRLLSQANDAMYQLQSIDAYILGVARISFLGYTSEMLYIHLLRA